MAYLEILTRNQLELVATSFILGLIFGISCDIIRITYILCGLMSYKQRKLVEREGTLPFCCRLMTDLCAALFLGAAASVIGHTEAEWQAALAATIKPKLLDLNLKAFALGQKAQ